MKSRSEFACIVASFEALLKYNLLFSHSMSKMQKLPKMWPLCQRTTCYSFMPTFGLMYENAVFSRQVAYFQLQGCLHIFTQTEK